MSGAAARTGIVRKKKKRKIQYKEELGRHIKNLINQK